MSDGQPNWIDVTTVGSSWDEQVDANARQPTYRHRRHSFTDEVQWKWQPGPAPAPPTTAVNPNPAPQP